jgi:hypothetical protein
MRIEWTLTRYQIVGLIAYTAILPVTIGARGILGDWAVVLGALISLPLAPIGFVALWGSASSAIPFALGAMWVAEFVLGWIMLVEYVERKRRKREKRG